MIHVAGGTTVLALISARWSPHEKGATGVPALPSAAPRWLFVLGPRRFSCLWLRASSVCRQFLFTVGLPSVYELFTWSIPCGNEGWGCRSGRYSCRCGAFIGSARRRNRRAAAPSALPSGFSRFCCLLLNLRVPVWHQPAPSVLVGASGIFPSLSTERTVFVLSKPPPKAALRACPASGALPVNAEPLNDH